MNDTALAPSLAGARPAPGANAFEGVERYLAPRSLAEALTALAAEPGAIVLAGGTDLMPQAHAGRVRPATTLINIRRLPELAGISHSDKGLRLGALATVAMLLTDPLVQRHSPLLVEAADHFASDQIRNAASVGGNLCNASPAGDLLTPLLALDAEVELCSLGADGAVASRRLPLSEFFVGPGRSARQPGELLVSVNVPVRTAQSVQFFYKSGTRPALDISTISIALCARRADDGALHDVRLALGAVGPTPLRARHAEALLEGNSLSPALAAQAALCASEEITPIDDVRASAWYRKELVRNMTQRALDHVTAN